MFELRQEERLKYSNQPSSAANVLNWGLVWLFGVLVLGCLGYGGILLIRSEWVVGGFMVAIGLFMVGLLLLLVRNARMAGKVLLRFELREEGYYTYVKQIKTGEESEHLVPFSQMQEVLIGRSTRYQPRGPGRIGYYAIGAKIVMKWLDDAGKTQFSIFGLESPDELHSWVKEFQKHGIPIYGTDQNVKFLRAEDYYSAFAALPKSDYDPDTNALHIGGRKGRDIPLWISPEVKTRMEAEEKRRDKRWFRPFFMGLFAVNLILAAVWMPSWRIVDGIIADDSASTVFLFSNAVLMALIGTYWRRNVRWYRSLVDALLIILAQLAGVAFAVFIGKSDSGLFDSIVVDGVLLILISGGLFVIFRLVRLVMK